MAQRNTRGKNKTSQAKKQQPHRRHDLTLYKADLDDKGFTVVQKLYDDAFIFYTVGLYEKFGLEFAVAVKRDSHIRHSDMETAGFLRQTLEMIAHQPHPRIDVQREDQADQMFALYSQVLMSAGIMVEETTTSNVWKANKKSPFGEYKRLKKRTGPAIMMMLAEGRFMSPEEYQVESRKSLASIVDSGGYSVAEVIHDEKYKYIYSVGMLKHAGMEVAVRYINGNDQMAADFLTAIVTQNPISVRPEDIMKLAEEIGVPSVDDVCAYEVDETIHLLPVVRDMFQDNYEDDMNIIFVDLEDMSEHDKDAMNMPWHNQE